VVRYAKPACGEKRGVVRREMVECRSRGMRGAVQIGGEAGMVGKYGKEQAPQGLP